MMRQYYELKQRASDAVLFFRMGDFYEIFGEDAQEVAPRLELVLTSRERGDDKRIPFCGVPHHSARNYWLRLLKMGFKVAIADQMEDPAAAKGIVRRDITRVLTPGCVDDLEALEADRPNYLMGVYEEPQKRVWALALCDISTGEFRCGEVKEREILNLIERFKPREVLVRQFCIETFQKIKNQDEQPLLCTPLPEDVLRDEKLQDALLKEVFALDKLEKQPCGPVTGGKPLIAALISYLKALQQSCEPFYSIQPLYEPETMSLDETAIRDLELFETVRRRGSVGSLFHEVNRTLTPMGARLLRQYMAAPLLKAQSIRERQEAVSFFFSGDEQKLAALRDQLKNSPDMERLLSRVLSRHAHSQELARVAQALEKVAAIQPLLKNGRNTKPLLIQTALEGLGCYGAPLDLLRAALLPEPGALGEGLMVFREGYDGLLDNKRELSRGGEAKVSQYEQSLRDKTGITSLKIKDHKTYGLLIEVTKSNLSKVPKEFVRKQTMVNCERFITPELQQLGESLEMAKSEAIQREAVLFQELLDKLGTFREGLRRLSLALAQVDVLQALATKAKESSYCLPEHVDGQVKLIGSRHPVVESFVGRHRFVPNDVALDGKQKTLLITGPNMAGKSTVMRQTALCALLHQIGSFVPARQASLPIFDRIFTRVGAADDLSRGQSTFMVEMAEAAHILSFASSRSLVILDEVGRGTSTQDGMAIASAILEELATRIHCYCLFATHYHEILPLAKRLKNIATAQTEVKEKDDTVVFTHRLIPGECDSSFGIEVAKIAGVPQRVIARAQKYLKEYQEAEQKELLPLEQMGLGFELDTKGAALRPIGEKLDEVNVSETTPLEALNILHDLKNLYERTAH